MVLRFTYPHIDIRVRYPMLTGADNAAQRSLNGEMLEVAQAHLAAYRSGAFEGMRSERARYAEQHPRRRMPDSAMLDNYATDNFTLWAVDSDLVSVIWTSEYFFGGAHPTNEFHGFIWSRRGGKLRGMKPAELFRAGTDSLFREAYIRAVIREETRRSEARFTSDQLREGIATGGVGEIVPTGEGIVVMGWPMARVIGAVRALIPFRDVAGIIDPNGPLARYAEPSQ